VWKSKLLADTLCRVLQTYMEGFSSQFCDLAKLTIITRRFSQIWRYIICENRKFYEYFYIFATCWNHTFMLNSSSDVHNYARLKNWKKRLPRHWNLFSKSGDFFLEIRWIKANVFSQNNTFVCIEIAFFRLKKMQKFTLNKKDCFCPL
jgi:hypothetical protein